MSLDFTNQFMVSSIDLATFDFPTPEIKVWSPLFGSGDPSVTVEAMVGHHRLTLWNEKVSRSSIKWAKDTAAGLLEEWNEDNHGNWLRIIRKATEKVHAFNIKQAKEYAAAKKTTAAALQTLETLEATHAGANA